MKSHLLRYEVESARGSSVICLLSDSQITLNSDAAVEAFGCDAVKQGEKLRISYVLF